ncbi:acylphosphatase [Candidatus Woesearchaeota archaeon]|nr:acylphosphatase [Candidatus Woesearchaeota archaeon]
MENARLHLIIKGRVQGVFFRVFARKKAIELNLKGWVKNTYEGDVEILAEGNKEKLKELLKYAWTGSPGSRVDDIDVKWEEYKEEFEEFSIRY